MLETGVDVDYTPLVSPKDAIDKADLIVSGELEEVTDGVSFELPDPTMTQRRKDRYVTFVVRVTKVLAGYTTRGGDGLVYAQVPRSPAVSLEALSSANVKGQIVLVLDDITLWKPVSKATMVRPAVVPQHARLFAPYADGLWLQGSDDSEMRGIGVKWSDLRPGWGGVRTVEQFESAIARAARE